MAMEALVTPTSHVPNKTVTVRQAARAYAAAGLSFFPIDPRITGGKADGKRPYFDLLPEKSWNPYRTRRPTAQEMEHWCAAEPEPSWAIALGAASYHADAFLPCQDVDYLPFAAWLQEHYTDSLLSKTWVVQTGTGGLHIYLWSVQPVRTHNLVGAGIHFGEMRGDAAGGADGGSYVVAPPSVHANGNRYVTIHGGPEQIARVQDAGPIFAKLRDKYLATLGHDALSPSEAIDASKYPMRIQAASSPETVQKLLKYLAERGVLPYVRKTIEHGPGSCGYYWKNPSDRSGVDFGVIADCLAHGIDAQTIEVLYASCVIGGAYRGEAKAEDDKGRAHRGLRYLMHTILKAQKKLDLQRRSVKECYTGDLIVARAQREHSDRDLYHLEGTIRGFPFTASVSPKELLNERTLREQIFTQCGLVIHVAEGHRGPKFGVIAEAIAAMAEHVYVAPEATALGQMRAVTIDALRLLCSRREPEKIGDRDFGWINPDTGRMVIRVRRLALKVTSQLGVRPGGADLWDVLGPLGAEPDTLLMPNGHREAVVTLAVTALDNT